MPDDELPALYGCADLFVMLCRDRWRGLEQEGFGIVFVEAAAAGVASVAGRSGGSSEAVIDGVTGLVVDRPGDVASAAFAIDRLLGDPGRREVMALAARHRVEQGFTYDHAAEKLAGALDAWAASVGPGGTSPSPHARG